MRLRAAAGVLLLAGAAQAQPAPALRLEVRGAAPFCCTAQIQRWLCVNSACAERPQ